MGQTSDPQLEPIHDFIQRWEKSGASERANSQSFLNELCGVLGVERPRPATADDSKNHYVFERGIPFHNGDDSSSRGFCDLYKQGCFVLEAKQGTERREMKEQPALSKTVRERQARLKLGTAKRGSKSWDRAMMKARGQAQRYARALPAEEGRPPFLIVVDVGYSFELYSEFSRTGGQYLPFPDARRHRFFLLDLLKEDHRELLKAVWLDPMSLDPSRRSAQVTQEIASGLARLAKSLEGSGHSPEAASWFLMRCLFTMFAEDVKLLPQDSFTKLLKSLVGKPQDFKHLVVELWEKMKSGGYSTALRESVLRFNGHLFEDPSALPLNEDQLYLLLDAATTDWRDVEPAIFGTLLERALDPLERHKLGAHYTPRAYVERLVLPTIIEPLREEWADVQASAMSFVEEGDTKKAVKLLRGFLEQLGEVRVLDPACGTGNFLYVTLEHLKRLEGEVLDRLSGLGEKLTLQEHSGLTVNPSQLRGLEVNPRAAAIADLVLWIGYLQWHFRTRGHVMPPEPVIENIRNIECRDAVLEWDSKEELLDEKGQPVTRWDGRTTKPHPVTGEPVPDESARRKIYRYLNPRKAVWPEADFVVGNPPFIGNWRMRSTLGDGYAEALRSTHPEVPESCEYVMYWWNHSANLARAGKIRRFGLIATNSLRQTFNRRVVKAHLAAKKPISILFAIPDHPWVDSADGADVRISMTVGQAGLHSGLLKKEVSERAAPGAGVEVELSSSEGLIHPDLTIGPNVAGAVPLQSNEGLSCPGVKLHGSGFLVSPEEARKKLGLGRVSGLQGHIRHYLNGRDLAKKSRNLMVIDLFGLSAEEVRTRFPEVYQWVLERVKPERDQNNRASYRENWWVFGEPRGNFRPALKGLKRYIATVETSKHRFFVFLDGSILPDNMLVNIASDDALLLGVLSSRIHVTWALAAGGRLGVGNDPRYNKTRCFETFPFPDAGADQESRIRKLAEELLTHRKNRLLLYPKLTMTDLYNVLAKLRAEEPPDDKERRIHEEGLVSVLRRIHDDLDEAVSDAYGWPADLSDQEILERLVELNAQRADEERRGLVRWLRPDFQRPDRPSQAALDLAGGEPSAAPVVPPSKKAPWPRERPEQSAAVRTALAGFAGPVTDEQVARSFKRARVTQVSALLEALVTLGEVRRLPDGRYVV